MTGVEEAFLNVNFVLLCPDESGCQVYKIYCRETKGAMLSLQSKLGRNGVIVEL
jgi:hypothetical protein